MGFSAYGDKNKGLTTEQIVGAMEAGLAKCNAKGISGIHMNAVTYKGEFVPHFMANLGLEDVNKVPAKSTIEFVYRSYLAQKKEEKIKAQHETHKNSGGASDSESSDSDENEESDGFVGSDSDDDAAVAATSVTALARRAPARRRNVPKSADELLTEELAPVRAALHKAVPLLARASGDKLPTIEALRRLGCSGGNVLYSGEFKMDDKPYAITWAKIMLPDEHEVNFADLPDARAVWRASFEYHQNLGDGALKERIEATQKLCAEASFQRQSTKPQNLPSKKDSKKTAAAVAATKKRGAQSLAATKAAHRDMQQYGIFDDKGAKPGEYRQFGRAVVPSDNPVLPDYVAPFNEPVWGRDAETELPIIVKSAPLVAKICLGTPSYYDIGIGTTNQRQEPIATIERLEPGDAAVAIGGAWCGLAVPDGNGALFSHRGRNNSGTMLVDIYGPPTCWADGDDYNWRDALPSLGMAIGWSKAVQTEKYGPLEQFQHVHFVAIEDRIPGGLEALDRDRAAVASKMRDAVKAHGDAAGSVRLAAGVVIKKLNHSKAPEDANYRLYICGQSRQQGEVRDATRATLDWLQTQGHEALHYFAARAALLGHVKLRLLAYAHEGSGVFHLDAASDKPKTSTLMATSHANAAPANLDSLNFSLASGPKKARMGPLA